MTIDLLELLLAIGKLNSACYVALSMTRTTKNVYLLTMILLVSGGQVLAQETSTFAEPSPPPLLEKPSSKALYFDPEEIVVTGSRNATQLMDAAVKTEVVSREFIDQNNLKSLPEVIERIPGVVLEENTGRSGFSAVMQGFGQDQVLIAIDGIPQLQTTSSGFDLTQLTAHDIEKVEVTKGGSSALYGSHAIGGVINIITRQNNVRRTRFSVDSQVGDSDDQEGLNSFIGANLSVPFAQSFTLQASFSRNERQATDLDKESLNEDGSSIEATNAKLGLSYRRDQDNYVQLQYRSQRQETLNIDSVRALAGNFERRDNNNELRHDIATLKAGVSLGATNSLSFNALYDDTKETLDSLNDPNRPEQFSIIDSQQDSIRSELIWKNWSLDNLLLSFGSVYQEEKLVQESIDGNSLGVTRSLSIDDKRRSTVDLFSQAEYFVTDRIEVSPGIRWQKDNRFDDNFTPKVNTKWTFFKDKDLMWNLRASVGTGFRTPSLKENFYVLDHRSIGNYIIQGNENLIPEESVSYQLGVEVLKGRKWSLHTNAFVNRVENMIERFELEPQGGTRVFRFINFEEVESRGVEFSMKMQNTYRFSTGLDYTFSETINKRTGLLIPNRPRTIVNLNAQYAFSDTYQLVANYRFIGDQFADAENVFVSRQYTTTDLKLNIKMSKVSNLSFGVNNVFDVTRRGLGDGETQDEEIRDARPLIGRYAYLGVTFAN